MAPKMMKTVVARPIVHQALQLLGDRYVIIQTRDDSTIRIPAKAGDWVVTGPGGTAVYSPNQFALLYEEVNRGQGNPG